MAADLMKALNRQGVPNTQIAARLGVTESGIRYALEKQGIAQHRVEQLPLPIADEPVSEPASVSELAPQPELAADLGPTPVATTESAVHGTEQSWDRTADRAFARLGLLPEALPQFGPAQGVRGAGALLALPALQTSGLLQEGRTLFSAPKSAFYGVRTVLLILALMGLLRMRTPEVLRRRCPVDLDRLLGLDRAPEVKTLRRKVAALAAQQRSEELMQRLASLRAEAEAEAMSYLYVDGHVRAYVRCSGIRGAWPGYNVLFTDVLCEVAPAPAHVVADIAQQRDLAAGARILYQHRPGPTGQLIRLAAGPGGHRDVHHGGPTGGVVAVAPVPGESVAPGFITSRPGIDSSYGAPDFCPGGFDSH